MSSLAATQADGYYLPVDFFESGAYKRKSKNQFQDTGSKLKNTTVRFELPYSAFCQNCDVFLQKGTRYNATKLKTDQSYFTTAILEFRMSCRACHSQEFVIRTNPAARGFDFVSGIQRKRREEPETGLASWHDAEPRGSLESLEVFAVGEHQAITETERLKRVQKKNDANFKDDALRNSQIRACFRADRKDRKRSIQAGAALGWREGLALLGTSTNEEIAQSKEVTYGDSKQRERKRFKKLRQSSIFKPRKKTSINSVHCNDQPNSATSSSVSSGKAHRRKRGDIPLVDLAVKHEEEPIRLKKTFIITGSGLKPEFAAAERVSLSSAMAALADYESESD